MRDGWLTLVLLLILAALAWGAAWAEQPFWITLLTRAVILALAGTGLNLALGLGGLVSLGHAAFFGIGGYAMGILAAHAQDYAPLATWPLALPGTTLMPVIWLVAMAAGALAALAIGALCLRTSGVYFIMVTLAFGQMFFYFAVSWPSYGGQDGLSIYVRNRFPGLNTLDPVQFFALSWGLLAQALLAMGVMARAHFGLALSAARQREARVTAVGLSPYRLRLLAFTLSGAVTALAGALFADLNRFVSPAMFSWQTSGEIMIFVILGGRGRLAGPLAGAMLFVALEHLVGDWSDYWHVWLGAILLGVVLFARGGIVGSLIGAAR